MPFEIFRRCWNALSRMVKPIKKEDEIKRLTSDGRYIMLCPEVVTPPKFAYKRPVDWQSAETSRAAKPELTETGEKAMPLRSAYYLRSRRCPCCFTKPTPRYSMKETVPRKKCTKISKKPKKCRCNQKRRCYLHLADAASSYDVFY